MGRKVVKVFLDSNVILSGLLSERGAPRILLDLLSLRLPFLTGSTGRYNLIEIDRDLKKNQIAEKGIPVLIKTCQNTPQLCWGDEWPPSPLGGEG
jgi:hypothetical protein